MEVQGIWEVKHFTCFMCIMCTCFESINISISHLTTATKMYSDKGKQQQNPSTIRTHFFVPPKKCIKILHHFSILKPPDIISTFKKQWYELSMTIVFLLYSLNLHYSSSFFVSFYLFPNENSLICKLSAAFCHFISKPKFFQCKLMTLWKKFWKKKEILKHTCWKLNSFAI